MGLKNQSDKYLIPLLEKLLLTRYDKVQFDEFQKAFSDTLYVAGLSVDDKVLDFITEIELDGNVKRVLILTPYSNIDKNFVDSWGGMEKYLSDLNIDLRMKAPTESIPSDVYFFDEKSIYFIPRNYIGKHIVEVPMCTSFKRKNQIMEAFASSDEFTYLKGNEIYYKKYNIFFQIGKRHLNDKEKEMILRAMHSWEESNYDDIGPIWRNLENKMREFIKIRLEKDNTEDWFSTKILPHLTDERQKAVVKIFEKSKGRLEIENIDEHRNPTEYLNPWEYSFVIGKNKSSFKDYSEKSNKQYQKMFNDCVMARNPAIHNRTPDEDVDLDSNIIWKTLMLIEWLNRLEPKLLSIN